MEIAVLPLQHVKNSESPIWLLLLFLFLFFVNNTTTWFWMYPQYRQESEKQHSGQQTRVSSINSSRHLYIPVNVSHKGGSSEASHYILSWFCLFGSTFIVIQMFSEKSCTWGSTYPASMFNGNWLVFWWFIFPLKNADRTFKAYFYCFPYINTALLCHL